MWKRKKKQKKEDRASKSGNTDKDKSPFKADNQHKEAFSVSKDTNEYELVGDGMPISQINGVISARSSSCTSSASCRSSSTSTGTSDYLLSRRQPPETGFMRWRGTPRVYINGTELPGIVESPCAVAVSPRDDSVYLTDIARCQVIQFTPDGRHLASFGSRGEAVGQFAEPRGITVTPDGLVAVSDTLNNRIQVLDPEGHFIRKFGCFGSGRCQFQRPAGLAYRDNAELYIADQYNNRIQIWSLDGRFVDAFGSEGKNVGQFQKPTDVAVSPSGDIVIADANNDRIQIWKLDKAIHVVGRSGCGELQFRYPVAVAVNDDGIIAVADQVNYRIHILSSSGQFIHCFGTRGSDKGEFDELAGIAFSPLRQEIIASDLYNRTIQIF